MTRTIRLWMLSLGVLCLALPAFALPSGAVPEVQNLQFQSKADLDWDPIPGVDGYNVYRGSAANLPADYGSCFAVGLPTNSFSDLSPDPAPGQVFTYLAVGTKGISESIFGLDSGGVDRPNVNPCAALPAPLLDTINPNGPDIDGQIQGIGPPRNPAVANEVNNLAGGGIYLHTGEFFLQHTDMEIPGRGINFRHVRFYRSQINHEGQQGYNWTFNYDRRLISGGGGLIHLDGTGRQDDYINVGAQWEPVEAGIYNKIRQDPVSGNFILRDRDGTEYRYQSFDGTPLEGRLLEIRDRSGNYLSFLYHSDGLLCNVVDTLGRTISYYWDAAGRLAMVEDFTGRQVRYTYYDGSTADGAEGDLRTVTTPAITGTSTGNDFPSGRTTTFTYLNNTGDPRLDHNLVSITAPGDPNPYLVNQYNSDDEVFEQTFGGAGAGGTYQYALSKPGGPRQLQLIDRNGVPTEYEFTLEGQVAVERIQTIGIRPTDPPFFETQHQYEPTGERLSTLFPLGNFVEFLYDTGNPDRFQRGNLLGVRRVADPVRGDGFGGGLADVVVNYEYETLYNQQRLIIDPAGQATEYVFDWQEGDPNLNGTNAQVADWNISLGGVPLFLGDLNGDGTDQQNFGNPILLRQPNVTLLPGGRQQAIEGAPFQTIETRYRYNALGQLEVEIDPENVVSSYRYHPENDPDGDGTPSPAPLDGRALNPATGGYLTLKVLDDDPAPFLNAAEIARRANGLNPPAAKIANDFEYDPTGNLTASVDGNGTRTVFELNQAGQIVSVRRGGTSPRSINLSTEPPLNGYVSETIYNARGEIVERRIQDLGNLSNSGGFIDVQFEFDLLGNMTAMEQEVGGGVFARTEYLYDPMERRIAVELPESQANGLGVFQTMRFDERGLIYQFRRGDDDRDASAGPPGSSVQRYDYDANGNLVTYEDGRGNPFIFDYDGMDRRVRSDVVPGRSQFEVRYNPDETIDQVAVVDFGTTVYLADYQYDEIGRVVNLGQHVLDSSGLPLNESFDGDNVIEVITEYDRKSQRTVTGNDGGAFTDYNYDGAGRVFEVDAGTHTTQFTYDANNNVVERLERTSGPAGPETFTDQMEYDRLNRLLLVRDNLGFEKSLRYDSRDNVLEMTDQLGNTIEYAYDATDRRIRIDRVMRAGGTGTGAIVGNIVYMTEYNLDGAIVQQIDPNGNPTTYEYDSLGRKIRDIQADGLMVEYEYDPNDNVVEVRDPNGSQVIIDYDVADRPTLRAVTPGAGVRPVEQTFDYDGMNRLVLATEDSPAGFTEVEFIYDSLNRIREESSQFDGGILYAQSHQYDGNGNRTQSFYPSGTTPQVTADPFGYIFGIQDPISGFSVNYDRIFPDRIAQRFHGNGTRKSYLDPLSINNIGYDGLKRVQAVRHYDPGNAVMAGFDYSLDAMGNITRESRDLHNPGVFDAFEYDSAYRLIGYERDVGTASPTSIQYNLDNVGNWLSRIINGTPFANTPNVMNQYGDPNPSLDDGIPDDFGDDSNTPVADGQNLGHDPNGNMITEDNRTYIYDVFNRLVEVEVSGSPIAQYAYDALNRRVVKRDLNTGVDTRYVYDGDRLIEQYNLGAGVPDLRFFYGAQNELVGVESLITGDFYYVHDDVRGSIVMVTDGGGGIVERITYDAEGTPRFEDPGNTPTGAAESIIGNPFLYMGQFWDPETRLYENRGAKYAPRFGRHMQRFIPGQLIGPMGSAYNVPMFFPCPLNWFGMNPFWWGKGWWWHPGAWNMGWWAWRTCWWFGGPWGWWQWRPWVWFGGPFASWWVWKPWVTWWYAPFRWWGWRAWAPWYGWWGIWPYWGAFGWCTWLPVWGWNLINGWWPWWGWNAWVGWWPGSGWFGWCGWWPFWNTWWAWHPYHWNGWWTWSPFWWHGYWGWSGLSFWWNWWGWVKCWWPWGWWNWAGWGAWWGWFGWNPWWWWGWWSWWHWGWIGGHHWWWGPMGWGSWFGWGWFWPWHWWGWWSWLFGWNWWHWGWGWFSVWIWGQWWIWSWGWWTWPWWGWRLWWGWWWPWWGWWC